MAEDEIEVAVLAVNAETAPDEHKGMTLIDTFRGSAAEVLDEGVAVGETEEIEEAGAEVEMMLKVDLPCREDLGTPRKSWIRICELLIFPP